MRALFLFFTICFLTTTCKKSEEKVSLIDSTIDTSWYPHSIGHWAVYQVDSIVFKKSTNDSSVSIFKSTSYLKEIIEEIIEEFPEGKSYKLVQYYRKDLSSNWQFLRNQTIRIETNKIIKTEDNYSFLKLFLPIHSSTKWSGNQYILIDGSNKYLENWKYSYSDINVPINLGNLNFDTSVRVHHINDSNAIEKIYSYEYYAKNVGLINSHFQYLEKQNTLNNWLQPENGLILTKTIIDYKK